MKKLGITALVVGLVIALFASAPLAAPPIEWKCAILYGAGTDEYKFTAEGPQGFVAMVNELCKGRLHITPYATGQIVPTLETLSAVGAGTIDMAITCGAYWAGKIPAAAFTYCIPYGYTRDWGSDITYIKNTGAEDILRQEYKKFNVHLVGFQPVGPTYAMSNKPVYKPGDWKGIKIRTIGLMADVIAAAGASISPVPTGEVYMALKTGVVDACTWATTKFLYDLGFHEVTKYLLLPEVADVTATDLYINMSKWNALPDDIKKIINMAEQAYGLNFGRFSQYENVRKIKELTDSKKLSLAVMPPAELAKMRAISFTTLEKIAKRDPAATKVFNCYKDFGKMVLTAEGTQW
jgi:TRAP-type mannitol/chloroaromatic compound transport system substrate-binding protein